MRSFSRSFSLLFSHWWYLCLSKAEQRQWESHWPDTPCGACPLRASQRQNRQQRKTKSSLNNTGPKIAMGFMTTAAGKTVDHLPGSFSFGLSLLSDTEDMKPLSNIWVQNPKSEILIIVPGVRLSPLRELTSPLPLWSWGVSKRYLQQTYWIEAPCKGFFMCLLLRPSQFCQVGWSSQVTHKANEAQQGADSLIQSTIARKFLPVLRAYLCARQEKNCHVWLSETLLKNIDPIVIFKLIAESWMQRRKRSIESRMAAK